MMCHLCDERLANANEACDEILDVQTEFREHFPERTHSQRVSDMANMWLRDLPMHRDTPPETLTVVQNIALFLATMTERVIDLKREANVS
jgi:hypothetical protein